MSYLTVNVAAAGNAGECSGVKGKRDYDWPDGHAKYGFNFCFTSD